MNIESVPELLTLIKNRFNREIDAIIELGKITPKVVLENMDNIRSLRYLMGELDDLQDEVLSIQLKLRELEAKQRLSLRWQKHWRILACKGCMGATNIDQLLAQAFYELVTEPPTDEKLDEELGRIADTLEELEKGGQDTKALRMIY